MPGFLAELERILCHIHVSGEPLRPALIVEVASRDMAILFLQGIRMLFPVDAGAAWEARCGSQSSAP